MDLLLIFPPISVNERYVKNVGKVGGHLPPLGIAYVASYLEENGFSVGIIDAPANEMDVDDVINEVVEKSPKVVGFTSLTSTFSRVIYAAEKIKEKMPDIKIIVGGHHATIMKEKLLRENKCFDMVVWGEGEVTAFELMKLLKSGDVSRENLEKIDGIIFRSGSDIIKTKPRAPIEDVDKIPFPARHLLPMDKYTPLPNQYKKLPVAHMIMIRGCPYQCSFCSNNSIFGRKIRYPSAKRAVDEIELLKKNYGIKEISFWDDMITANKTWLNDFCNELIERDTNVLWSSYARVDSVNPDMLKLMKKAGCWNIFYGIESGDQRLLNNINKGITLSQSRDAVKWTKQAGIEVRGSFMLCIPGETPELARKTIDFAIELDVDYAQFGLTTPYPGTELYDIAKKYGRMDEHFDRYNIWDPVFLPWGYRDEEEAKKMMKEAFRSFYLRPKYLFNRLVSIRSLEDITRYVKGVRFVLGFSG